ncbi:MAG: NAD+ synthase [Gammaproteobacteria bacterium]|jgi:NAD+ synthase (glutamine-hydrolysing)|tara:strand:+ start:2922 stop:4553 length:1632 start_codon:yes stop_codon:yes gene_type:complete
MTKKKISIGIVQENPIVGDIEGNLQLAINAIDKLSKQSSPDIFLFTEMFITGYPPEDLILRDDLLDASYEAVEKLCEVKPESFIVIGYPKKEGDSIFNCAGVLRNKSVITEYKKQELPNYEVFDEKRYFQSGKGPGIFEVNGLRVGLSVCEDIWHENVIKQLHEKKTDLILNINASPFHLDKIKERKVLISGHAINYSLPIVYANQVGGQDELVFDGTSMAMDGEGQQILQLEKFKEDYKIVNFTSDQEGKLSSEKREEIPEDKELEEVYKALVLGAKDYIQKNNFPGVLIGSSGGIDSALTAAIAADAIGPEKVRTFMLPFKFTSDMSVEDSEKLAVNLGIKHSVIPIGDIYESFADSLEDEFSGLEPDITEENLQSRCRGVILMALSNKSGELVLTTGNKSETAVGYSTLYGDTAGGFGVLKDVPKTLVYELSRYRNTISHVIPDRIIDRPPSAELAPDQQDSDSLPDYAILDKIIELYVEQDKSKVEIEESGIDKSMVDRVIRLIDLSEYKRRQAPLGVKITSRGFGKDRRYPITNKFLK